MAKAGRRARRAARTRRPGPREALTVLREWTRVPVGVSVVVEGLGAVDVAFRQATLALRSLPTTNPTVAPFDQRLPEALLLSSPDVAERLVQAWLGPLLDLPEAEQRALLTTLEIWVGSAGSTTRTAQLVHCHRNTVINRLRRISVLTGHELVDRPPLVELSLALRAHRLRVDRQA